MKAKKTQMTLLEWIVMTICKKVSQTPPDKLTFPLLGDKEWVLISSLDTPVQNKFLKAFFENKLILEKLEQAWRNYQKKFGNRTSYKKRDLNKILDELTEAFMSLERNYPGLIKENKPLYSYLQKISDFADQQIFYFIEIWKTQAEFKLCERFLGSFSSDNLRNSVRLNIIVAKKYYSQ